MSDFQSAIRDRIVNAINETETKMVDKQFKSTLESLTRDILSVMKNSDSEATVEAISKTLKKQLALPRLETKLSTMFLIHTIFAQISNKSKSDFHSFFDNVESEIAPTALNSVYLLLSDQNKEYSKTAAVYKSNIHMMTIVAILLFFNTCKDRFSQGHGGRNRRFDSFTQNLEISDQIQQSFNLFSNLNLDLLKNRTNYFEKSDRHISEEGSQEVKKVLSEIAVNREKIHSYLTMRPTQETFNQLYQYLEIYEEQLDKLDKAKAGRMKSLSEDIRKAIGKENDFGKFVFDEFYNVVKNEGSGDLAKLQSMLLVSYEEIFAEEGTVTPAVYKSKTMMVPDIKTEGKEKDESEFFEDNSNQNHVSKQSSSNQTGREINKFENVIETDTKRPVLTNMFDKPKLISGQKVSVVDVVDSAPRRSFEDVVGNVVASPSVNLGNKERGSFNSVEPKRNTTERGQLYGSVEVTTKSRRFEDAFADEVDADIKESRFGRSSVNSALRNKTVKDSKIMNMSAIERKSLSSFIDGRSMVKLNFGASKVSGRLDPSSSEDRKHIVGEALSKVSTLVNQKKAAVSTIRPSFSQQGPQTQQSQLPTVSSPGPQMTIVASPKQLPTDIPKTSFAISTFVPVNSTIMKPQQEQAKPYAPVYEERVATGQQELPVPTTKNIEVEDKEQGFDIDDFPSADSRKLETPPEKSINDRSNILPASLKGSLALRSSSINQKLGNDFMIELTPETENPLKTAINRRAIEHKIVKTEPRSASKDPLTLQASGVTNDQNMISLNRDLANSRENSKNDISDNYSQHAIDENLLNDKKALEAHIAQQKAEFQSIMLRSQKNNSQNFGTSNNDLEKDLEAYKAFVKTITADYDRLLANNKMEIKEYQQNIEAMVAQNEKYKHRIFKIENEIIALSEEKTRLKNHFSSQKTKYEENIAKQRDNIIKTMETKIKMLEKVNAEKLKTASLGSFGELNALKAKNQDLDLLVKSLRLETETVKNQRLNDMLALKEKTQSLRNLANGIRADFNSMAVKVNAILDSRKMKESGVGSAALIAVQSELMDKLKAEQKRNDELKKQITQGTNESNFIRSDLTFTNKPQVVRSSSLRNTPAHAQFQALKDSMLKLELWVGVALQGLSSQVVSLTRQNRNRLSKRLSLLDTQNSSQLKELSKLKFQNDLSAQDYMHLKDKNYQLSDEIQALKKELVEAKKSQVGPKPGQFDTEMMKNYRQLQHQKDSLHEMNKRILEEKAQLIEKLALCETETNCSEKVMEILKKLESENEQLMQVNRALYNEVISLKSNDKRTEKSSVERPLSNTKYLPNVMTADCARVVAKGERQLAKSSNVTGIGFIKKMSFLMDHLNENQRTEEGLTIIDWLEENVTADQFLMAQICTTNKYNLIKTDIVKVSLSEDIRVGQSETRLSVTMTFTNLSGSTIGIESMKLTCDSSNCKIQPIALSNFSLKGFDEGSIVCEVVLEPNYLFNMSPIFVSFNLIAGSATRLKAKRSSNDSDYFNLPVPLTINKLVNYQQEDISKFGLLRTLEKVAEQNIDATHAATADIVLKFFPQLTDLSGEDTAFWVKVCTFFGTFFMTVLIDQDRSLNVKLFAMFESPIHATFLRTIAYLLSSV